MSLEANQPLVSIIIPCYNCDKWVQQAVESGLNQTYPNIEIVVVDDGSTDGSLEVLRQFLPRIRLETGPNRGGNVARNRAFELSTGEYVQYLDADDYLELDKTARQIRFLEETRADVVYGDWRYRRHLRDSSFSYLDKTEISGVQQDIIASLLSGWWVGPGAVLYTRRVVKQVGGWDETLRAAQDKDFFTSVALSGAKIQYQPGCCYIYRQYGAVTVSSSGLARWVESHSISLEKSKLALARSGRLTDKYRTALAVGYFGLARGTTYYDCRATSLWAIYGKILDGLADKILNLCPDFHDPDETRLFTTLQRLLGFRFAMNLLWVRAIIRRVKLKLRNTPLLGLVLRIRRVNLERETNDYVSLSALGRKEPLESRSP
jgi:glycosyltransferase involved in cell wall biosynthesis